MEVANYPVYLDYNATAPLRPEALAILQDLQGKPLNPSSVHKIGRKARQVLESSRALISEYISVFPGEIYFCASGTEANNWILNNFHGKGRLVSSIEHPSVLNLADDILPVDEKGVVKLAVLDQILSSTRCFSLVSIMLANNETGVLQPLTEIAEICRKYGIRLHCDASQALGKIPMDCGLLGADFYTISSHKCGGPAGAAALIARGNAELTPLLTGGGQEMRRRAGTENVAAIAAFARAVEAAHEDAFDGMKRLRHWLDAMEQEIIAKCREAEVFSTFAPRLPNTSCLSMPGVASEVQLMHFDLAGFAVSAGAACSSGRIETSRVLKAMQVDESTAKSSIRVSGGWNTREEEIRAFTQCWLALYEKVGKTRKNTPQIPCNML